MAISVERFLIAAPFQGMAAFVPSPLSAGRPLVGALATLPVRRR